MLSPCRCAIGVDAPLWPLAMGAWGLPPDAVDQTTRRCWRPRPTPTRRAGLPRSAVGPRRAPASAPATPERARERTRAPDLQVTGPRAPIRSHRAIRRTRPRPEGRAVRGPKRVARGCASPKTAPKRSAHPPRQRPSAWWRAFAHTILRCWTRPTARPTPRSRHRAGGRGAPSAHAAASARRPRRACA